MTKKKKINLVNKKEFFWILITAFVVITLFTITYLVNDEDLRVVPERSYANPQTGY